MPSRRNVLIGLGGLMAGGGALFATGAFTTVEAQRTMNVETADDADAFLGLEPADESPFVEQTNGTIEINLDAGADADGEGINENSRYRFQRLVTVTNNGTQDVTSLTVDITTDEGGIDINETFQIVVSDEGDTMIDPGENLLNETDPGGDADLQPEQTVDFGLHIDLVDGGVDNDLPDDGDYTMVIEAETAETP